MDTHDSWLAENINPENPATGQDDVNALSQIDKKLKTNIRKTYIPSLFLLFRMIIDLKV